MIIKCEANVEQKVEKLTEKQKNSKKSIAIVSSKDDKDGIIKAKSYGYASIYTTTTILDAITAQEMNWDEILS